MTNRTCDFCKHKPMFNYSKRCNSCKLIELPNGETFMTKFEPAEIKLEIKPDIELELEPTPELKELTVTYVYKEHPLDIGISTYTIDVKKNDGRTPIEITEHQPQGEGDVHYCLVRFDNNTAVKICRPDLVGYKEV